MTISRRQLLAAMGGAGAALLSGCGGSVRDSTSSPAPSTAPTSRPADTDPMTSASAPAAAGNPSTHTYGSDPSQFGELYRPTGAAQAGTVVIVHGGFWRAAYDLSLGRPLATDLMARGYTVWNIEYRRVGDGGGWPSTFDDVAAAIDLLADLDVDTDHVCAIGHSAGGQLAAWATARQKLPTGSPGADPAVIVSSAVAQAGVLDLITAAQTGVGGTAVPDLVGGTPDEQPIRYRLVDPVELLPVLAPVLCVHGRDDDIVPLAQSTAYVDAAHKTGSRATLTQVDGDHFTLIDPSSAAWQVVVDALPDLLKD